MIVLTPELKDGRFPYRKYVEAHVSLSGNAPLPFDGVVFGPALPDEFRLMRALQLWCYAQCSSCMSPFSSAHQRCNPTAFYLDPVQDMKRNRGFVLDQSGGTLTGNVTFEIKHRPRKPKPEDQAWRCPFESLM